MAEKTKTIGIMGGGQLGLMIVEQAHLLGARTLCLDPAPDAPAFALSDGHIVAAYDDAAALEELCRRSDVVTYEFENVPGSVLIPLEKKYNIPQGFRPLYDSQDRLREKDNARANGLRTPLYAAVDDEASLRAALAEIGFPAVLKTRTLGYDGHGQLVLKGEADVPRALPMLSVPCILEAFVPFDFEASIVMVSDGERVIHFPIGRNVHRDGILDLCFVPAEGIDDGLRSRMAAAGERFMKSCRYRGILAIEFFIRDGEFYFNEMAPRPHNSGHYTIEGCTTNQFRELVRFLLGEPLQEAFVPFDFEASIVMVSDGERVIHFPIGRNVHRDGILDLCFVPAEGIDDGLRSRMAAAGERFMKSCRYRGILAIEFFIRDGEFYFNEMAPRPHNSGHYTIEGCTTNQFRELVRFLLGEPLQEPQLVAPTVMKNILGQDLEAAERIAAENRPGVHVHLYGKTESRPKRKMGHITFVGMDAGEYGAAWADRFVK